MTRLTLVFSLCVLFAIEILRVYLIMPFPGSQHNDHLALAYFISSNIFWLRLAAILLLFYPAYRVLAEGKAWHKMILTLIFVLWATIFYFFNFRFEADKMFHQPGVKTFATAGDNQIPVDKLVIGVEIDGEAKAFPIELIGYHHQVADTIGKTPVIVTYCTVCRTGRVYSPLVNGRIEHFRLVGMNHFNAMFEDSRTKSWWQQATGVAVAGPLTGNALSEIPSGQYRLDAWLRKYPGSLILQPDPAYQTHYDKLADYDKGTLKDELEKRDSADWNFKSWVIGVRADGQARTYSWNDLVKQPLIQDRLTDSLSILLVLEKDSVTFHVWNRKWKGSRLDFIREDGAGGSFLTDINTRSRWNEQGLCVAGPLKGAQLAAVPAYQEFLHSWEHFHPNSQRRQP